MQYRTRASNWSHTTTFLLYTLRVFWGDIICNIGGSSRGRRRRRRRVSGRRNRRGGAVATRHEIHVGDIQNIQPASWNRGEFSSGSTSLIEVK